MRDLPMTTYNKTIRVGIVDAVLKVSDGNQSRQAVDSFFLGSAGSSLE
jgi:hypothetical protein